jgi:hypothetical protein
MFFACLGHLLGRWYLNGLVIPRVVVAALVFGMWGRAHMSSMGQTNAVRLFDDSTQAAFTDGDSDDGEKFVAGTVIGFCGSFFCLLSMLRFDFLPRHVPSLLIAIIGLCISIVGIIVVWASDACMVPNTILPAYTAAWIAVAGVGVGTGIVLFSGLLGGAPDLVITYAVLFGTDGIYVLSSMFFALYHMALASAPLTPSPGYEDDENMTAGGVLVWIGQIFWIAAAIYLACTEAFVYVITAAPAPVPASTQPHLASKV